MKFLDLFVFLVLFPLTEVSSSSSCEELRNIISRLSSRSCGEEYIQLDCKGDNPIIYTQSTKFLIKDISFQNTTFRLVDSSFSATGDHCHLPNQNISNDPYSFYLYYFSNLSYIYFVNCTQEIENSEYVPTPCQNRSNSRVYALTSPWHYTISEMHDSCRLIGQAITDTRIKHVSYAALMQAIERAFLVNWTYINYIETGWYLPCSALGECWSIYIWDIHNLNHGWPILLRLLLSEQLFLRCLYLRADHVAFSFMLILVLGINILLILILARVILAPLAIYSFLLHKCCRTSSSSSFIEKFLRKNELLHIRRYDFIETSIMTNHFKEKLGQGGFGSVYKGKLLSGQQVAVKILSNPVGDGDDFISEVATIGRIHHTNIVRLIGFCSEGSKRALIYAYMPNGSLDKYIFSSSNNALSMEKRREIAIGIARGIDYLHRGCEMQILNFDIKPHNILLDHNLVPKIFDFGLARLYPRDYSLVTLSMARGTIGYIAPELISRTFGAVSYKADVYSFGMLLMEMASGRRNVNNHVERSDQVYYPSWIYDQINLPNEAHNLTSDVGRFGEIEERLYKVALWCIQMKASNRPTMTRVIEMLQNDVNSLEMPPRPSMICTPHEFSVRPSRNESRSIELSLIS